MLFRSPGGSSRVTEAAGFTCIHRIDADDADVRQITMIRYGVFIAKARHRYASSSPSAARSPRDGSAPIRSVFLSLHRA